MSIESAEVIAHALSFIGVAILIHAVVHGPSSNGSQIGDVAKAIEKLADVLRRKEGSK